MIIGIDASNIRSGGGIAHLVEILKRADPLVNNFEKVFVWSSLSTLDLLPNFEWLNKKTNNYLNKTTIQSTIWKLFFRDGEVRSCHCNVLFLVDSTFSRFHPSVTICHNILPFSKEAIRKYKLIDRLAIWLRKINSLFAFKGADRIIMLSNNSLDVISKIYFRARLKSVIISHGFDKAFENIHSFQAVVNKNKIKVVYVSTLSPYKLQGKVVEAIFSLLDKGYNIELYLIGADLNGGKRITEKTINKRQEYSSKIFIMGEILNQNLPTIYKESDVFVFASICETFGISLLEAMSSGIPIACSKLSAMPELLQDTGHYFDPNSSAEIADSIERIIKDPENSKIKARKGVELSRLYSWDKCAKETFELLVKTGQLA